MSALKFFRPPVDTQVQFLVGEYGIPVEPVLIALKARPDNKTPQFHWDPNGLRDVCEYPTVLQHTAKIIDKDTGLPTGQVVPMSDALVTKLKQLADKGE